MKNIFLYLILALLFLSLIIYIVINKNRLFRPIVLDSVEIKEYQGENLSSVNDFRENSIKGPQFIDKENYKLKIIGLKNGDLSYTYNEIVKNYQSYQKLVKLDCVEGWSVKILWEGIKVKDLFDKTQIPESAKIIIFRAYDGYSTSFPINYILDNDILMAYKINGATLPPERGFPFQLVAEDKWGYKWIKWITEIEFSSDENYKGYWEQRGYSNSGNLKDNFR